MTGSAVSSHLIGFPQIASQFIAGTTEEVLTGTIVTAYDPYWGGREFIYCYAAGTIDQFGCVSFDPTLTSGHYRLEATAVANTANLGRSVGFAMVGATVGQYIWVCLSGLVPMQSTASVAATTAFGIVAAGKVGAIANGKQICNARNVIAATATVVKANCTALSASRLLKVPNADGWFIGAYLSGTGIGSGARVASINATGTEVTMTVDTTAVVSGSVTATYNNGTVFYNVAWINRPFAQGQIT